MQQTLSILAASIERLGFRFINGGFQKIVTLGTHPYIKGPGF